MTATRVARQTATIRAPESVLSARSCSSHCACRPMSAKTAFSRRNAIVRQLMRSAIRDWAVCRIGALWPRSRPATTTATTPEEWSSSATRKHANGITKDSPTSRTGSVIRRRIWATTTKARTPISTPPTDATRKSKPTRHSSTPTEAAAIAVRRVTSAVASLKSDSPSRMVTTRRGRPMLRAIAVAATASGGATTAPSAKAIGQEMPGTIRWTTQPAPAVVTSTAPTDSVRITRRWALKSTSDEPIAVE